MRRPNPHATIAFFLSVLASSCPAQVRLVFESSAPRIAWVGAANSFRPPANATKSSEKEIALATGSGGSNTHVFVVDESIGNLATKSLKDAGPVCKLTLLDFNRIAKLTVNAKKSDAPLAAGLVVVTSGKETFKALLTPSDQGSVDVYGVPPGSITIAVETNKSGEPVKIPKQVTEIAMDRSAEDLSPTIDFAISADVDIVAPTNEPKETSKPNSSPETSPGASTSSDKGGVNPLVYILALGASGGVAYALIKYLPQHKDKIDAELKKIGVQIPTDPAVQPDDQAPPQPLPDIPDAPATIDLGSEASIAPAVPVVQPSATPMEPTLICGARSIVLTPGSHTVTREPGSLLSFEGESSVSRAHAVVTVDANAVTISDSGSTNGTFVNGAKIETPTQLKNGDTVHFGAIKCEFRGGAA